MSGGQQLQKKSTQVSATKNLREPGSSEPGSIELALHFGHSTSTSDAQFTGALA
jgi:hypothetical protein